MGRPKYFTPNEVSVHNTADDLWVSFLGKVYNLTPLCEKYKGKYFINTAICVCNFSEHNNIDNTFCFVLILKGDVLLKPIIQSAGKDISHWFNPKTKEVQSNKALIRACSRFYFHIMFIMFIHSTWLHISFNYQNSMSTCQIFIEFSSPF